MGVIEVKPCLLFSLAPLGTILRWIAVTLNIGIRNVVTSISDAHMDHYSDKLVVKLFVVLLLAFFNELD